MTMKTGCDLQKAFFFFNITFLLMRKQDLLNLPIRKKKAIEKQLEKVTSIITQILGSAPAQVLACEHLALHPIPVTRMNVMCFALSGLGPKHKDVTDGRCYLVSLNEF